MPNINELKFLENLRTTMQRERIRMGNRKSAVDRGMSEIDPEITERYANRFLAVEEEAKADIAEAVKDHKMWDWMQRVKGIGPGLAGCLLAHIDIERAQTVSGLWKYAGQGVSDGVRDKPTKGEKLPYNAELKRICYLISSSFMKSDSPYREEYEEAKEFYQRTKTDWTAGHIHNAASRKMVKLFLSHLWEEWRTREGLSVRPPYALQVLNHDGYKPAEHYLKPPKKKRAKKAETK